MITSSALASAVSADRLWADLTALARLGARPEGGVRRLALDGNDVAARQWLVAQARTLGASAHVDDAGNLFLRLEGTDPQADPVVTGSHIDSQPAGGAYDGAYGVLAGLAVLRALHDTGTRPRRPVEVVAWTNEEGVRFAPGCSGSSCFTGKVSLSDTRALEDPSGVSFGEAVDHCLNVLNEDGVEKRPLGTPIHAFVELHIEQGPILERAGLPIGVVEGIQGVAWFEVKVKGTANHAGTTPRAARADALEAACELARVLRELAWDRDDVTRFTIGRWSVQPDSINTIPDTVTFTIDLRHPQASELDRLEQAFAKAVSVPWVAGCSASLKRLSRIDPVSFPVALVNRLSAAVQAIDMPVMRITSGAFHDAIHLASHCPTAMLFIPCEKGVSHHPSEAITPQQAAAGARALAAVVLELANG